MNSQRAMSTFPRHTSPATRAHFSPLTRSAARSSYQRAASNFLLGASTEHELADALFGGRLIKPGLLDRSQPVLTHYPE